MQNYPLYDILVERVNNRENKVIDIGTVCATINNIESTLTKEQAESHYKEIYGLIVHHELKSNGHLSNGSLPYNSSTMISGKGILFDITKLPALLQQIIAEYIINPNCN